RSSAVFVCWAYALRAHGRRVYCVPRPYQPYPTPCHCCCARGGALTHPSPSQAVVDEY
ncbi:uncharacterized protein B0H18DRAFT_1004232, partial [Fomitopsis serialis]|uniref:uncharacterized protein n=1 Tax=Fomitopsis serialis TaxID=139415 RepID=UPI0020078A51